jgi:hypothetical protein
MSSPRYLTSLSDIILFIKQRTTGWEQLPALIAGITKRIHFEFENREGKEHLRDQSIEKAKKWHTS